MQTLTEILACMQPYVLLKPQADCEAVENNQFISWTIENVESAAACERGSHLSPVRIISMALLLPTALISRWVPPMPGMTPSEISGCTPNMHDQLMYSIQKQ